MALRALHGTRRSLARHSATKMYGDRPNALARLAWALCAAEGLYCIAGFSRSKHRPLQSCLPAPFASKFQLGCALGRVMQTPHTPDVSVCANCHLSDAPCAPHQVPRPLYRQTPCSHCSTACCCSPWRTAAQPRALCPGSAAGRPAMQGLELTKHKCRPGSQQSCAHCRGCVLGIQRATTGQEVQSDVLSGPLDEQAVHA